MMPPPKKSFWRRRRRGRRITCLWEFDAFLYGVYIFLCTKISELKWHLVGASLFKKTEKETLSINAERTENFL